MTPRTLIYPKRVKWYNTWRLNAFLIAALIGISFWSGWAAEHLKEEIRIQEQ